MVMPPLGAHLVEEVTGALAKLALGEVEEDGVEDAVHAGEGTCALVGDGKRLQSWAGHAS